MFLDMHPRPPLTALLRQPSNSYPCELELEFLKQFEETRNIKQHGSVISPPPPALANSPRYSEQPHLEQIQGLSPLQNVEESKVSATKEGADAKVCNTKESEVSTPELKMKKLALDLQRPLRAPPRGIWKTSREPVQSTLPSSRWSPKARIPATLLWSTR